MDPVSEETKQILRDLNSWWEPPHKIRPVPPPYRRSGTRELFSLGGPRGLIHVVRGPRQVGKTTALYQLVEEMLRQGAHPLSLMLVRFDLPPFRELGLLPIVRWHVDTIRSMGIDKAPLLLLDEVHKLRGWDEQVKHVYDTFAVRIALTGSVLVARGQRESLAGRAVTVDFPPFPFREVLEAWYPDGLDAAPHPAKLQDFLDPDFDVQAHFDMIHRQPPQRRLSWRRRLDRYYSRGGYPRLYTGEVHDDRWADYLVETVFDRVLGVDIPDLFPVDKPGLLCHIYVELARRTGTEVSQSALAQECSAAGFATTQPVVGRYIHYLADALLVRELRRYPLARRRTARVPAKIMLTDLGVRNAIFRGAPSLWESPPDVVGPLVETLVQTVLGGPGLQVHFFRDFQRPGDRRSPIDEVDFVVEGLEGRVLPIEVKFRKRIDSKDIAPIQRFMDRFGAGLGLVVTRNEFAWNPLTRLLHVPLLDFLLAL